jgi:hypothetical protein
MWFKVLICLCGVGLIGATAIYCTRSSDPVAIMVVGPEGIRKATPEERQAARAAWIGTAKTFHDH